MTYIAFHKELVKWILEGKKRCTLRPSGSRSNYNQGDVIWVKQGWGMSRATAEIWIEVTRIREYPLKKVPVSIIKAEGYTSRRQLKEAWDSIYGDRMPYASNPLVRAIYFRIA